MKHVLAIYMFTLAVQAPPIYAQTGVDVQSIPFDMGTVVDDGDVGGDNKLFDMGTTEPAALALTFPCEATSN